MYRSRYGRYHGNLEQGFCLRFLCLRPDCGLFGKADRFSALFQGMPKGPEFYLVTSGKGIQIVYQGREQIGKNRLEEVKYFKSEANYIAVVMNDRKILTLMTLKDLEPKLPEFFQKVHRSYIVNLNCIDFIDSSAIEIGKDHIPVSQRYEKELFKKIELLNLSLIHISEPTRRTPISYAVFCLKKKKKKKQ